MVATVLVVDDDPYTRQLIRRVISKEFDVRLLEAEHGVAALELLLSERVDVVLLDVSMPVMDGVETLEAIRRAPGFSDIPVMVLAGRAEEEKVMRLVELGIAGFLVKPFRPTLLSERMSRLLKLGLHAKSVAASRVAVRLGLHRRSRVLVVDRGPEFCDFFGRQLAPLCEVEAVCSLPAALSRCMDSAPDAVFVGALDRLIESEVFVRKIRALHPGRLIPVVAITSTGDVPAEAAPGLYDGGIARSYVPETLRASVRALLTDGAAARWVMVPEGPCISAFCGRAQEHMQATLGTVVSAEDARPRWSIGSGRWVVTALEFHAGELSWDLRLQMPYATALRFASASSGLSDDEVSEEGLLTALSLLAEHVGTVLCELASEEALEASCGEPRVSMASMYTARESRDPACGGSHWWLSCGRESDGVAIGLVPLWGLVQGRPGTAA